MTKSKELFNNFITKYVILSEANKNKIFYVPNNFACNKSDSTSYEIGLNKLFYFSCFNEALLWFLIYSNDNKFKCNRNVRSGKNDSILSCFTMNGYWSKIPTRYRELDKKKGITMTKNVLAKYIKYHDGIPVYFNESEFQKTFRFV